jgi:hypothetical protein
VARDHHRDVEAARGLAAGGDGRVVGRDDRAGDGQAEADAVADPGAGLQPPERLEQGGHGLAAWTLAVFAIGALAGMLFRRVVPAIVATIAVYVALAFAAGGFLRQHYLAPLVTSQLNVPGSGWLISQWATKGGKVAYTGFPPDSVLNQYCPAPSSLGGFNGKPKPGIAQQCLAQHGFMQFTSYQPASRFWDFQWIEAGWLLALSVLLIAATIWLVRRRAALRSLVSTKDGCLSLWSPARAVRRAVAAGRAGCRDRGGDARRVLARSL